LLFCLSAEKRGGDKRERTPGPDDWQAIDGKKERHHHRYDGDGPNTTPATIIIEQDNNNKNRLVLLFDRFFFD